MSRSLPASKNVRRAVAAAALVFAVASLSACGDSGGAATSEVKPDNANVVLNGMHVQNVQLVVDPAAAGQVAVTASIVNDSKQADVLKSVTIDGVPEPAALAEAKTGSSSVAAPVNELVKLGGEGASSAVVATDAVKDGSYRTVTFTFANAGRLSVHASTTEATGDLAGFGPSAVPSASESPAGGASPNASESPNASVSPSPSGSS